MSYEAFEEDVLKAADAFKQWDKGETVRVISHLDADGIASCSILIRMLNRDNRKYSISIVQQLKEETLQELGKEPYKHYIFSDLGSGQLNAIEKFLKGRNVLILDHHKPETEKESKDILQINPCLHGIEGSREISGAGVAYWFAKTLDMEMEKAAHIAIIGAIGDVQEQNGFLHMNDEILKTAVKHRKIKVERGLRMFGLQGRPLHKVLEYSTDPYIPGVSGSESGSIQFLQQLGIDPKRGSGWKRMIDLSEDEKKKLVSGIVMKRLNEEKPEDILGNIYTLLEEKEDSITRNAKEFATLLNACGRMGKASLGIGACLGDKRIKEKAIKSMSEYRREIVNALRWYENKSNNSSIIRENRLIVINAGSGIMPTLIGTLASIISKSNGIKENTFVMGLARMLDGTTKVSLRLSGKKRDDISLRDLIKSITDRVGGEAGGHVHAAGALISSEKEETFIEATREILGKIAMEEFVD